jgi:hypothetical protein
MRLRNLALPLALGLLTACSGGIETSSTGTSSTASSTAPTSGGGGAGAGGGATGGPSGPESFVRLSEGVSWCGVRASGKVACWEPGGKITAMPGIDDAVAASANFSLACVLRASGKVACWGYGVPGQVGDTPTDVPGVEAIAMSIGTGSLCFVRPGGQVVCLDGAQEPIDVPGVADAVQIAGSSRGCARRQNGQIACWESPGAAAEPIAFVADATQIASSDMMGCALHATGEVSCWKTGVPESTIKIPGITGARRINVGSGAGCAIDAASDVTCFTYDSPPEVYPALLHDAWDVGSDFPQPCVIHLDGALDCGPVTGD